MRLLFYMGHPAHFHLFKNTIHGLRQLGHDVKILIKKKDILEELLKKSTLDYLNINPEGRADNKFSIAFNLLKRDVEFFKIARKFKPHLMIGTSAEITHVGKLLGIKSIVVNEDDAAIVPLFAKLSYPFASWILAPECCNVGKWSSKKIAYRSLHELAYLHPNHFFPDPSKLHGIDSTKPFFILRFAKLTAHHDAGRKGINTKIAGLLIEKLTDFGGNIYITSERELEPQFEKYRIHINPLDIHHALFYAHMYIGDSQTMAAEAAVLGTPSIRFNDFVGQISYLEELEHRFSLTFGFETNKSTELLIKVNDLLSNDKLKEDWAVKRTEMLRYYIDFNEFMIQKFSSILN
jgi:predicted glycosyltransferase